MSSFNGGQKWSLEMVIDPRNAFLKQHSNPDPSSFNSLSLESFPDNGKCPLCVSQAGCLENELDTPVEEVKRDTDYLPDRFCRRAGEKMSCQQMPFCVETELSSP